MEMDYFIPHKTKVGMVTSGARRIFVRGGGGGSHCKHTIDGAPGLKKVAGFSFLKIFGSVFQTRSRGIHRPSSTSLTSKQEKKKKRSSDTKGGGGGFTP